MKTVANYIVNSIKENKSINENIDESISSAGKYLAIASLLAIPLFLPQDALAQSLSRVNPNQFYAYTEDVQKAINHVELLYRIAVIHQIFANFLTGGNRILARSLQKREHHHRKVAFKLFLSGLQSHLFGIKIQAVQCLYGIGSGLHEYVIYRHNLIFLFI